MKKVVPFLLFVLIAHLSVAQNLNPAGFHTHRESLKNSFLKFQNEKKGRVAFLGGSITYNPGWRDSVCNYLQQRFPETEFDFIAAGIPSMGSTPAAFRFERDVLKNGPVDLLFEEAAVNDDTNSRSPEEMVRGMEGIVRHARSAKPACDIVIMHFVDPGKMDEYRSAKIPVVIQQHEKVAEHYTISTINLAKEVTERIDAGEFDWDNDFVNLHPSPFGQGVYARSIIQFLEDEFSNDFSKEKAEQHETPTPLDKFCYDAGKLIAPNPPKPIKGWEFVENWHPDNDKGTRLNYTNVPMLVGEYPGKIIKFQFKGNAVGIAVAAGPDAGIIEYSIDDQPWEKQDLFTQWSNNLYLPWYFTLESGLKNRKHTIQIRLSDEKNPESTGRKCVLRYFYFN
ncbi:GDSL-type esterase/lipase family protein [Prolixibacteraceae bacterium Z1-6]|uniref:GDSL-type esterase/lipase family protein n=1 Tax=Draconibacterium aestuarii TaxID=2998507 RepID=A0A9X3F4I8_9BACT|nr:GDSL-type esterase/lipase family protein [Prolixibacteraceae bacterium Z1-6]